MGELQSQDTLSVNPKQEKVADKTNNAQHTEVIDVDKNDSSVDECYAYPAVFHPDSEQEIAVVFPDLNAATSGETQEDAAQSARELLGCVLIGLIEDGQRFPVATPIQEIRLNKNEKVVLISISKKEFLYLCFPGDNAYTMATIPDLNVAAMNVPAIFPASQDGKRS